MNFRPLGIGLHGASDLKCAIAFCIFSHIEDVYDELELLGFPVSIRGEAMKFAAFLDRAGEFFDTIHFPDSLKQIPMRGSGICTITGKVVEDLGYPSIEVTH